jgi:hypothetical protein
VHHVRNKLRCWGAQYALVLTPVAEAIEARVFALPSGQSRKLLFEQEALLRPAGRCASQVLSFLACMVPTVKG